MGRLEKMCPLCYHKLPLPRDILKPYDDELSYFMWLPGFEWQPPLELAQEEESAPYEESEGENDEDMQEALAEMVEKNEIKDKFNERAVGGRISSTDAVILARQLGLAPAYADIEKFKKENGETMDYATFEQFAAKSTHPEDSIEDLVGAFAYFDESSSGYLSFKQIKNILTTWGEPLTMNEVDRVKRDFFPDDDKVDYRKFCEVALARK